MPPRDARGVRGRRTIDVPILGRLSPIALLFVLEPLFAGFYVTITRSITPILLVSLGYTLRDLLVINALGGVFSLLIALIIYESPHMYVSRGRLLFFLFLERVMWFSIYFASTNRLYLPLIYGLALASTLPTSIFMNISLLSLFDERTYRRVVSLRGVMGGVSSVLGQLVAILILFIYTGLIKYFYLYMLAFIIGLLSVVTLSFTPGYSEEKRIVLKTVEDVEVKAVNIFMMLTLFLASISLLNIVWIPYIMRDLGAPDYFAATIGFTQTITGIISSMIWINRKPQHYRYAMILLSILPPIIFYTKIPLLHLIYAAIISSSSIGANFYASFAYSKLVKKMGVYKAGVLLSIAYFLALTISSSIGYIILYNTAYVFILSSIFSLIGLSIALFALQEFSVVKPVYSRIYSRIIYNISLFGYTTLMYSLLGTARLVLKIIGLLSALLLLLIIYKIIYYIIQLGGG